MPINQVAKYKKVSIKKSLNGKKKILLNNKFYKILDY